MGEATERVCPACSSWMCRSDDAYCGACGRVCAQLRLDSSSSVLPLGQVPPRVSLRLTNPTCAPLRITRVTGPSWIDVAMPDDVHVASGQSRVLRGKANTFGLTHPESASVRVLTSLGEASDVMMVIQESPALAVSPTALEFFPSGRSDPKEYVLRVAPEVGQLRVRGLVEPREEWATFGTAISNPLLVGPDRPLSLRLRIDPARLPAAPSGAVRTLKGTAAVAYDGPHGPAQAPFEFALDMRRPPELTWTGEHKPPRTRLQTPAQVVGFTCQNSKDDDGLGGRRNAVLEIVEATLKPPAGSAATVQRLSPLPVSVVGGDSTWLEFQVNCEGLTPAIHDFHLDLRTNLAPPERAFRVPLQVQSVEPFDGVVAIDFGTSNTCYALLSEEGDLKLVPLDESRTTAPTIVRYLDLSGPAPVIETGALVQRLAAVDERIAGSTVSRLKQHLGDGSSLLTLKPEKPADWITREAREAAADYLSHLRTLAERKERASFHEFILTHPAVCSLTQFRNLRAAVEKAFGGGARVHFLQEPIASLVPFFSAHSENGAGPSYTVAAFDLGGGTTDITVVRVTHRHVNGVLEIHPEILASWGERFGGENLTDFLVDTLKARCDRLLADDRPGYRVADKSVRGASTSTIRSTEMMLRAWAESFKVSLSDEDGQPSPPESTLVLRIVPDALDQLPDVHTFWLEDPRVGENLRGAFLDFVADNVRHFAARLEGAAGDTQLDFIQLSGKTAFLRVVGEVLHERFPHARLERAAEPKECVVRGACLWRALSRGQRRRLVMPADVQRTTSQIGLVNEDGRFLPVIALDQPIPLDGIVATLPGDWGSDAPIVLWENLGIENERSRGDGSRNPLITRLGFWDVPSSWSQRSGRWTVQLRLRPDFTLQLLAGGDEGPAELVMRPPSRGRS